MSEWRNQLQEMGREAFILHEMQRLGFWPDNSAKDAVQATAALARLAEINAELAELRNQLQRLRLSQLEKAVHQLREGARHKSRRQSCRVGDLPCRRDRLRQLHNGEVARQRK